MNELTTLDYQRKHRPKIDEVAPYHLSGEPLARVTEFAAWLRANKMSPAWAGIHSAWAANCKGKTICKIWLKHIYGKPAIQNINAWHVSLYLNRIYDYQQVIIDEGLQNVLWDNIRGFCSDPCPSTKGDVRACFPGVDLTLCGKEFERVCACRPHFWIYEADEAMLGKVKRLLELEKMAR